MTAAKGSRGSVAAKGQPVRAAKPPVAKTSPGKSAAKTTGARHAAKTPVRPAQTKPAAGKAVARPTATRPPAAKAPPAKAAPAKTAPAKTAPAKAVAKPLAKPVVAKSAAAKSTTIKTPGRKGRGDGGSEANLHKRVDSERIAQHIAAFEKSGGRVEKLGVTRVLQKVSEVAATAPAQAVKTGSRKR